MGKKQETDKKEEARTVTPEDLEYVNHVLAELSGVAGFDIVAEADNVGVTRAGAMFWQRSDEAEALIVKMSEPAQPQKQEEKKEQPKQEKEGGQPQEAAPVEEAVKAQPQPKRAAPVRARYQAANEKPAVKKKLADMSGPEIADMRQQWAKDQETVRSSD